MHLLAVTPGSVTDGSDAVDLRQTPGDILFLSAADTELACLARGYAQAVDTHIRAGSAGPFPSLRLANLMQLGHNLSVDLYIGEVVAHAKLVLVRLIGGTGYWPYGVEQLSAICRNKKIPLALLPGDDQPDPELTGYGSLDTGATQRLWRYMIEGGIGNAAEALRFAASMIGTKVEWREPAPLPKAGYYLPGRTHPSLEEVLAASEPGAHPAPIVFYRALVQAGNTAPVDALIEAMRAEGLGPVPIFVSSLKDPVSALDNSERPQAGHRPCQLPEQGRTARQRGWAGHPCRHGHRAAGTRRNRLCNSRHPGQWRCPDPQTLHRTDKRSLRS